MPEGEPTRREYVQQIVRDEIRRSAPHLGIVTGVHPHTAPDDDSNYEVDVDLVASGHAPPGAADAGRPGRHTRVPVAVPVDGATHGLQVDEFVLVEYLQGNTQRPVVTQTLYDTENRAPLTDEGDFRRRIGENAVIEIVTNDAGEQIMNLGRQPDDHGQLDMGLSMNLDSGGFSLSDASGNGLFFDGQGNGILKWESFAMPIAAAGDVTFES